MKKVAIIFSKPKDFPDPFSVMGEKRPVYEELTSKLLKNKIEMIITSRKAYLGNGNFQWYWKLKNNHTILVDETIKTDLGFDRSGGLNFPLPNDNFRVVDNLDFKKLAWDKWEAYKLLGEFMPKTLLVKDKKDLTKIISEIKTDFIVLKPLKGLKGNGIYIGPKEETGNFKFQPGKDYLAQEFLDTSKGIENITTEKHDLRVVIINGKIVWSHVRIPPKDSFKANAAQGGTLIEVDIDLIPKKIIKIVQKISNVLYNRYDNPIYSIDFGVDNLGNPYVFEINDQMGFPKIYMKAKDLFLSEMIENFKSKL